MKEILNILKEEIKKVSNEETINIAKLNQLTNLYDRVASVNITSISQLNDDMGNQGLGYPQAVIPRNETSMVFDLLKEYLHTQSKKIVAYEVDIIQKHKSWLNILEEIGTVEFHDDANKELITLYHDLSKVVVNEIKEKLNKDTQNSKNLVVNEEKMEVVKGEIL